MISPDRLSTLVDGVTSKAVELRRVLHRHPEPSHEEHRTTELIAASLEGNGIAYQSREPKTGLWLDLGPEAMVGFRADIDALPIMEPEDRAPRSENPGWMHACGHDAHAAIAVGISLALHQLELPVGVRVLFQPAEESFPGGAIELVADGLVDGLKGIMAFHIDPSLATGKVGSRVGPITASADRLSIVLEGPGGHTARPHQTVDLVAEAARLVHELPVLLRRTIDARSPLTVAFGSIHGGHAGNVIPTHVEIHGTARTLDRGLWERLPGLLDDAIGSLTSTTGAECTVQYEQVIPPVVNDEAVVRAVTGGITSVLGPDSVVPVEASMGGEDFANYLSVTPGALLRLGSAGRGADLHSPGFLLDEGSVGIGIRAGVAGLLGLIETL